MKKLKKLSPPKTCIEWLETTESKKPINRIQIFTRYFKFKLMLKLCNENAGGLSFFAFRFPWMST